MAVYLEEFLESIDSLPTEVQNHLIEIKTRDDAFYKLRRELSDLQKEFLSISSGNGNGNGKDDLMGKIKSVYEDARRVSEEKCVLSERLVELIQKHDRKLMELLIKSQGGTLAAAGAAAAGDYSNNNYLQSSAAAAASVSGVNSTMKLIETSSDSSASSYGNYNDLPLT
jgi:chromosome segregation ATPase